MTLAVKRLRRILVVVASTALVLALAVPVGVAAAAVGDPGTIASIAGGPGVGDGGLAVNAYVGNPIGVAIDSGGNVYFVDQSNSTIRKVAADGTISRAAGLGFAGFSGDGGPAVDAELSIPYDVAIDGADNLYIAD